MTNVTPTSPAVPTTISNLPAAASVTNADLMPIVQGGVTKSATASQFAAIVAANTIIGANGISASTAAGVTTISGVAATNSAEGVVKPDNTTISVSSGVISVISSASVTSFTGDGVVLSNSASTGAVMATLETHSANTVLAGPTTGSAHVPTFRALVAADLPFTSSPITNSLASDVTITTSGTYYDGPSVAQGSVGTWFASGTVTLDDSAGQSDFLVKLWDGTTVLASAADYYNSNTFPITISLSGFLASPVGNLRMSCTSGNRSGTSKIIYNYSGNSMDSTITAFRIA